MTIPPELIERLERADGPSRELDLEIGKYVPEPRPFNLSLKQLRNNRPAVPAFTASIDAALTLVPEGMSVDIHRGPHDILSEATVTQPVKHFDELGRRCTSFIPHTASCVSNSTLQRQSAAIALCIAALKARLAMEQFAVKATA